MFKQVKSVIFWTLLYKFRKRLTLVAILLAIVLLSQWIYADIVEYLQITQKVQYLDYILPAKWIIILFNIGISTYLILTLFKTTKEETKIETKTQEKKETQLSEREKSFLTKKIRNKAEILLDQQK